MFSPTDKVITLVSFVNTGYKDWNAIHDKQTLHNKYHDDATKEASGIITKFEGPNNIIPYQINDTLREKQKKVVEALVGIIHLLRKQANGYRRTEEKPMIMTLQEILKIL